MSFIVEKNPGLIPQILSVILDECINGVTLSDPDLDDMPIVYANRAFINMTGYAQEEIVGKNCRFLQGNDREQEARYQIADAIKHSKEISVTLRNYKKNGELFYNRLKIIPLFDRNKELIYFLGIQDDITLQVNQEKQLKQLTS